MNGRDFDSEERLFTVVYEWRYGDRRLIAIFDDERDAEQFLVMKRGDQ